VKQIYKLAGHGIGGGRRAVRFTPDGKRFLSWGDDFYLRIWDVTTGKALVEHAIRPTGVKVPDEDAEERDRELFFSLGESVFSSDGKRFVLNVGKSFHVFDTATGKELRQIANEGSHVISLTISPDSKFLLASAWSKGVQTRLPDGRVRFSSAQDHPVCLWDLSSGKLLQHIVLPEGGAGPVAFSPDGRVFAVGTDRPARQDPPVGDCERQGTADARRVPRRRAIPGLLTRRQALGVRYAGYDRPRLGPDPTPLICGLPLSWRILPCFPKG